MLTTCPVCRVVRLVGDAGAGVPCPQHRAPLEPYRVRVRRNVVRFEAARSGSHSGLRATVLLTLLFIAAGILSAREVADVRPVEPQVPAWVLEPEPVPVPAADAKPQARKRARR